MKVSFNRQNKSITFLDGTTTINVNDINRHKLYVDLLDDLLVENVGETLWAVFSHNGVSMHDIPVMEIDDNYRFAFVPQELITIPGQWDMQLFVRVYETIENEETGEMQTVLKFQESSEVVHFEVENGLQTDSAGAPVTNFTIAELFRKAEEKINSGSVNESEVRRIAREEIDFKPIRISSFSILPSQKEKGDVVSSVTLSWVLNKTLSKDGEVLKLFNPYTNETINLTDQAKTNTTGSTNSIAVTIDKDNNKSWKLTAIDDRGNESSLTKTVSFLDRIYYGVSSIPDSYNSDFVKSLGKNYLSSTKVNITNVTAVYNEYIYYCLPTRYGTCTFTVGTLSGGFEEVSSNVEYTNGTHKETYRIYRSVNANLGKFDLISVT